MAELPMPIAEFTARSRMNFAVQHLMGATRAARLIREIEGNNVGQPFGPFFDEVLGNASACVLLAVAGLESFINELFADRDQHFSSTPKPVLERLWAAYDRKPLLQKFDLALALFEKGDLDKNTTVYSNTNALIKLRNGLVHFRPEWFDDRTEHERVSRVLAGRFTLSPWLPNEGAFPRAWATYAGAAWAVDTAVQFLDEFDQKVGRDSSVAKFKSRLTP